MKAQKDMQKAMEVTLQYQKIVRLKSVNPYMKLNVPKEGSKSFTNCVRFYDCAEQNKIPLLSFFLAILDWFPEYWCRKVFNKDYPPFNVITSDKSRDKALRSIPQMSQRSSAPDQLAEYYFDQLKDLENALEMIEYGFFEDKVEAHIKDQVVKMLKAKEKKHG